jgi:hypothetical protein
VKVLAAPFDRDKAERARNKFLETQMVIEALERAMNAEERALRWCRRFVVPCTASGGFD